MDRNLNASPIIQSNKNKDGAFGYKANTPKRFQPKMTEVVEETEPESSFKETEHFKKRKSSNPPPYVIPEDRDDDFSDESDEKPAN